MKPKIAKLILLIILFLATILRLYKIDSPIGDWHSWRQADTASVTRYYTQNPINLLTPKYHDLSSIPSGQENPEGYRMVEFPVYNGITAFLYKNFFYNSNFDTFHRLVSVAFSLGSLLYLYLITSKLSGQLIGLLSALFFAILPYNVFYSRTILPEVPMVFFSLASTYHFLKILGKKACLKTLHFYLSLIFFALALLIKPYTLILLLPALYLLFNKHGLKTFKFIAVYIFAALSLAPLILWRSWINQFPEGIPAYLWLLNSNNIRFKGSFFHWIFAERIGNLILGYWGLVIFGFGLVHQKIKSSYWFYLLWLLSITIYLTIFATGNVQHDYYQIITIPIISIFLGKGATYLLSLGRKNPVAYLLLILSTSFMMAFSWFGIRGFYNINHPEIIAAGKAVNKLTPKDAKLIAPYQGDTAFLYQTNRPGWPIGGEVEDKIKLGATHYITVNQDDEANWLLENCQENERTSQYILINLDSCNLN